MYLAMNRFKVMKGSEEEFETVWKNRDSQLDTVDGFLEFNLLKGPETEEYVLYASHTIWTSEEAFIGWTKSEQFRKAHANAGNTKVMYMGPPQFEGFFQIDGTQKTKPS